LSNYYRQHGELLSKHKDLENAHVIQLKFIHKLQKKNGQIDMYIDTIKMQENIISEMQNIIKSNSRNTSENGENKNILPAISPPKNEKHNDENNNGNIEYDKNEIQKVIEKSKIRLEKMSEKV
jgi:hypothetical protein